jgi:hypothetical protein
VFSTDKLPAHLATHSRKLEHCSSQAEAERVPNEPATGLRRRLDSVAQLRRQEGTQRMRYVNQCDAYLSLLGLWSNNMKERGRKDGNDVAG